MFVVAAGQRVADAVDDFACSLQPAATRIRSSDQEQVTTIFDVEHANEIRIATDDISLEMKELYLAICADLSNPAGACDSPLPSRLIDQIHVGDYMSPSSRLPFMNAQEKETDSESIPIDVIYVRAGYSPEALVNMYLSAKLRRAMDSEYEARVRPEDIEELQQLQMRLTHAVGVALETAAMNTWKYTPFALLDERYLKQLLLYSLTEMRSNSFQQEVCASFEALCRTSPDVASCTHHDSLGVLNTCAVLFYDEPAIYRDLWQAEYTNNHSWSPPKGQ